VFEHPEACRELSAVPYTNTRLNTMIFVYQNTTSR
jgi:hypothetical protein